VRNKAAGIDDDPGAGLAGKGLVNENRSGFGLRDGLPETASCRNWRAEVRRPQLLEPRRAERAWPA